MTKKVLFLTDKLHSRDGGVPTAILNIAGLFEKANISFDILNIGEEVNIQGMNIINYPMAGISKFKYSKKGKLWLLENAKNYDVLYYHSLWSFAIISLFRVALDLNKTYFFSSHGSIDPFDLRKKSVLKKYWVY